jgi:hypothetical protein
MIDPVRWFDTLGSCACGKSATGRLMGPKNESYGISCQRCADRRIKKADLERAALSARWDGSVKKSGPSK